MKNFLFLSLAITMLIFSPAFAGDFNIKNVSASLDAETFKTVAESVLKTDPAPGQEVVFLKALEELMEGGDSLQLLWLERVKNELRAKYLQLKFEALSDKKGKEVKKKK